MWEMYLILAGGGPLKLAALTALASLLNLFNRRDEI
jgi:hypothetical protein